MQENKVTPFGVVNEDAVIKYLSKLKNNKEIPLSTKSKILKINKKIQFKI